MLALPKEENAYCFAVQVISAAERVGISAGMLDKMLKHSTRITHPNGNRRYDKWLFMVEDHDVVGFGRVDTSSVFLEAEQQPGNAVSGMSTDLVAYRCEECKDKKMTPVFNECDACFGAGCKGCRDGLVKGYIPCMDCARGANGRGR